MQPDRAEESEIAISEEGGFETVAGAARRLEIFLDLMLARATAHGSARFLLDSRFKSSLAPADHELSQALLRLFESLSEEARSSDGGQELIRLMQGMGWEHGCEHGGAAFGGSGAGHLDSHLATRQSCGPQRPAWLSRLLRTK